MAKSRYNSRNIERVDFRVHVEAIHYTTGEGHAVSYILVARASSQAAFAIVIGQLVDQQRLYARFSAGVQNGRHAGDVSAKIDSAILAKPGVYNSWFYT